jgi:hypothetical protein
MYNFCCRNVVSKDEVPVLLACWLLFLEDIALFCRI